MNGYPRTKKGQALSSKVRRIIGKKTVLLQLVLQTLSVGHLLNILVEKPSRHWISGLKLNQERTRRGRDISSFFQSTYLNHSLMGGKN